MRRFRLTLLLACAVALPACRQSATPGEQATATRPAQAVLLLTRHLRDNDLVAFARDAVPPALHVQLETAWREGRSTWPLEELPFDDRLPTILQSLAADGAEAQLQQVFDRQFAGADIQIRGAATSLGLFASQYIAHEGDYSADERQHYAQLIDAVSRWGTHAPLGDRARARGTIARLTTAARTTGLASPGSFTAAGMDGSLARIGPFAAAFKQALAGYGLDVDASLAGMRATLQQQTGDEARVRMQYRLGGQDIDTVVSVQRIDGRWYLDDYLRHARAAVTQAKRDGDGTAGMSGIQ